LINWEKTVSEPQLITVPVLTLDKLRFRLHKAKSYGSGQCCRSRMFSPDPDFYLSRIQKRQQKRVVKKLVSISFILVKNFPKLKINIFLNC
jgi:hypothetical protein